MYKIVDNIEEADLLWRAGLAHWRYRKHIHSASQWRPDDTNDNETASPANTWDRCEYAVLLEE